LQEETTKENIKTKDVLKIYPEKQKYQSELLLNLDIVFFADDSFF